MALVIAPANSVFWYRKCVCSCLTLVLFIVFFTMNHTYVCYPQTENSCMCD